MTTDHPDLIELCQNCTKPDCPGTCSDYNAIKRRIRAQERSRYYTPEQAEPVANNISCSADTLCRVNLAVRALSELLTDPAAEPFMCSRGAAEKMLEHMKRTRYVCCQHLIDWDGVASNAKIKEEQHD